VGDDGYLDSSLLEANASADGLAPTHLSTEAFAAAVVERNGLFLGPTGPDRMPPSSGIRTGEAGCPCPRATRPPAGRKGRGDRPGSPIS
jgi:hypothetical protein